MKCQINKRSNWTIVDLVGSLKTEDDYEIFKTTIDKIVYSDSKNIILNFEDTTFINSSGLGRLVLTAKKTKEMGGRLRIVRLSDGMKELFHTTRLNEKFVIFETEEEALEEE